MHMRLTAYLFFVCLYVNCFRVLVSLVSLRRPASFVQERNHTARTLQAYVLPYPPLW
jgi:hypothetical protein